MSPAVAWLVAELLKITIDRLAQTGKYETLTEDEAKAMAQGIADGLSTSLPTPEELENQTPIDAT